MLLFLISKDHRGCTGIYLYVGSEVVIIRGDNSIRLCRQWYGYGPGFCSSRKISDILYAFVLTAEPISSCHCHFYNVTQTDNSEVLEEWTPLFVYLVLVVGVTEWVMHLCLLQLVRYLEIVSQGTAAGSDLDVKKGVPAGFTHSAKYIMTFNPSISLIYEKGRNDTCDIKYWWNVRPWP